MCENVHEETGFFNSKKRKHDSRIFLFTYICDFSYLMIAYAIN
jgi:hypothetical protein